MVDGSCEGSALPGLSDMTLYSIDTTDTANMVWHHNRNRNDENSWLLISQNDLSGNNEPVSALSFSESDINESITRT